jgi:hypothetical protein
MGRCANEENEYLASQMEKIIEEEILKASKSNNRYATQSHTVANYKRALFSIRQTADAIVSAEDAKKLKGIGNFLGQRINAILRSRYSPVVTETADCRDIVDMATTAATMSKKRKATSNHTQSAAEFRGYKPSKEKRT